MSGFKRKLVVNREYQFKEVRILALANVLAVLLTALLLSWFFLLVWDDSLVVNYNVKIPLYIGCTALLVLGCSIWLSIWRSRSIAGMIAKLSLVLNEIAEGKIVGEVQFRRTDPFGELATPLNRCLKRMGAVKERRELEEHLTLMVQEMLRQLDRDAPPEEILRRLDDIAELRKQL